MPTPPLADPVSLLGPLEPGSRVVWWGQPRPRPTRAFLRRYRVAVAFALYGAPVYLAWVAFLVWSGGLRKLGADPLLMFVTLMLALSALTFPGWLLLGWSARRARTYALVVSRSAGGAPEVRGAVVDPMVGYVFRADPASARVEGDSLCFGGATPEVVARGRYPWSLPAARGTHTLGARFEELDDPHAVLAELRAALAD